MISHKHKCIFIHVPKCAGTSIEKALGHWGQHTGKWGQDHRSMRVIESASSPFSHITNKSNILATFEYLNRQYLKNPHNQNNRNTVTRDQFERYFKFAIVRNPWSRAVSWYKAVIRDSSYHKKLGINKEKDFSAFLQSQIGMDGLKPQLYWLKARDGGMPYNYIGKFEELDHVFLKVQEHIKLSDLVFPHELSSRKDDYKSYYTESTKKLILSRYAEEIEMFNYSFEN
ncbi:MAG: sulfotransferase family 2 domain-containing protein [Pseudomonadota bacterium]|nr:sulfotransferase family 2 domain-containing protein [Pseudomonadota bacterium]